MAFGGLYEFDKMSYRRGAGMGNGDSRNGIAALTQPRAPHSGEAMIHVAMGSLLLKRIAP